tara:strand:+ start:342 stop:773 length:432 start_codon:yes stop_codon:yes gene_type:complete
MAKSYKGLYRPTNPRKYVGNPNQIVYRSNLERKFMIYCDKNDNISQWASEELPIPYKSPLDNRIHRYFPDFIVKTNTNKKFIIEIKPYRQCKKPKLPKRKTKNYLRESMEYAKNVAKWNSAKRYCSNNNMTFKIITERDLGSY